MRRGRSPFDRKLHWMSDWSSNSKVFKKEKTLKRDILEKLTGEEPQSNRFAAYGYTKNTDNAMNSGFPQSNSLRTAVNATKSLVVKKRKESTRRRLASSLSGGRARAGTNPTTSTAAIGESSDSEEGTSHDEHQKATVSDSEQEEDLPADRSVIREKPPRRLVADICRPSLDDSYLDDDDAPVCSGAAQKRKRVLISDDSSDESDAQDERKRSSSVSNRSNGIPPVSKSSKNNPSTSLDKTRSPTVDLLSPNLVFNRQSSRPKKARRRRVIDSDDELSQVDTNGNEIIDLINDKNPEKVEDLENGVVRKKIPSPAKNTAIGRLLSFFNEASESDLRTHLRCGAVTARKIAFLRKFTSKFDLEEKLEDTPGLTVDLIRQYKDTLGREQQLDSLLLECDNAANRLSQSIGSAGQAKLLQEDLILMNSDFPLKTYQLVGLNWLWTLLADLKLSAVLADEMGLGKTIQVIAFLSLWKQRCAARKNDSVSLVVVPASTLDNWLSEVGKFCPALNILLYYGSQEARGCLQTEFLRGRQQPDIVLTSYSVAASKFDADFLRKQLDVQFLILDEAHQVKNCKSNRYMKLMKMRARQRILLTGTPLQNNLTELISLLHFMMPQFFARHAANIEELLALFEDPNPSSSPETANTYTSAKINQVKAILRPFILRRVKAEVLSDLPAKESRVELCGLSDRQRSIYRGLVEKFANMARTDLKKLKGRSGSGILMDLRKAANHPLLLRCHYDDGLLWKLTKLLMREPEQAESREDFVFEDLSVMNDFEIDLLCAQVPSLTEFRLEPSFLLDSAKFAWLGEMLPKLKREGLKVLVFSQFKLMLDLLEPYCKRMGHSYLRLDGDTAVVERQDLVNRFNGDPSIFLFLLSTRAGGLGVNLTGASHIILHDIDFNPYNDKQAEDRCHRVGQTKNVTVYRLLCEGTIDERMHTLAKRKLELEQQIIPTNADDATSVESLLKAVLFES